jgi:hypothetical protein
MNNSDAEAQGTIERRSSFWARSVSLDRSAFWVGANAGASQRARVGPRPVDDE